MLITIGLHTFTIECVLGVCSAVHVANGPTTRRHTKNVSANATYMITIASRPSHSLLMSTRHAKTCCRLGSVHPFCIRHSRVRGRSPSCAAPATQRHCWVDIGDRLPCPLSFKRKHPWIKGTHLQHCPVVQTWTRHFLHRCQVHIQDACSWLFTGACCNMHSDSV